MFNTLKLDSDILDTFKMEISGIFLKQLHALRTYEAYQQINKLIDYKNILLKYDEIESKLLTRKEIDKVVRVVFSQSDFSFTYSVSDYVPIEKTVSLQLKAYPKQLSGLGPQNYKWVKRQFWDELIKEKSADAFDVISVNEKNELVETSRFNIFLFDKKKDIVFTPALTSGCINGVYRRFVFYQNYIQLPELGKKQIQEICLTAEKIYDYQLFVANSVREVLLAELL